MTDTIHVKGARVHNLQNLELHIPRGQLVVFTGVSGSGKSSLVFDTLYAEGHRRYVESLSSYARQFLSRMQKPDVDFIHGLSPAIAIEQRTTGSNPRSTVGTATEVLDYLRLLFARIGKTFSPISGRQVTCHNVSDVVDYILHQPQGSRVYLLAELKLGKRKLEEELQVSLQKGFTRIWRAGQAVEIEDLLNQKSKPKDKQLVLLIDRFVVDGEADESFIHRMADSVQTAFNEGGGHCLVQTGTDSPVHFSELYELDGIQFERPSVQLFNFNNSYGACPTCEGFGRVIGVDENLVVPDKSKSVYDNAVAPWKGAVLSSYLQNFIAQSAKYDFPIHRPYYQLTQGQRQLLWRGNEHVTGIDDFFRDVEAQAHKVQYRVLAARYRGYTTCHECGGSRLRKEALYVQAGGYTIAQLLSVSVSELRSIFAQMALPPHEVAVSSRLLTEITTRLRYLDDVGLGYLNLSRKINTLSGGEMQRINLATSLGSNLTGSLYILDEPSIGLHPRDGERLIQILLRLREMGNTVLVVEHDEAIMQRADYLFDIGPQAGEYGGTVVFGGKPVQLQEAHQSLTAQYLTGKEQIPLPARRRKPTGYITVAEARAHNLKNITVDFPLGVFVVVTGVSGSGKSTLVKQILHPALQRHLGMPSIDKPGEHGELRGDLDHLKHLEMVDQQAIGKNLRSNPVTYVGAYDAIREFYANLPAAKERQLKPLHFSFNVQGGRCETCQGEGQLTVQMQFLPDIKLTCETCGGQRFKQLVLEVKHKEKNIHDVLQMSVSESMQFFADKPKIMQRLQKLMDVGLGYVRLGQSTSTLSGGEAQRLKLASFLDKQDQGPTLYLFDEPTTGLHFHDIRKLMEIFYRLVEQGHSVLVIEHNLEVIKCADYLIDLGPEGGDAGGHLVYAGEPEGIAAAQDSHTARYLLPKLGL